MDNPAASSKTKQKAVWYYKVDEKSKGPVSAADIQQLCKAGIITKDTLIRTKEMQNWKPLSQFTINKTPNASATNSSSAKKSIKKPVAAVVISLALVIAGVFCYIQFFLKTPLEGGWQSKNFLGITSSILLFDNGKCWLYDSDKTPYSGHYRAVKDGENSYTVTFSNNSTSDVMVILVSFEDENTMNVAMPGSTKMEQMTRMNKTMAKNMMGID